MTQGVLPYKIEEETTSSGMTALAGLPAYLDLAKVLNLAQKVTEHVKARDNEQGWKDTDMVMALILLQLAGGDCVDDMRILESDEGFCRILQAVELDMQNLTRPERRRIQLRWRKEKNRSVPSPSSVFRFLKSFTVDESTRQEGHAWIPKDPAALAGLRLVNRDLIAEINQRNPQTTVTLDMDATLKDVFNKNALFSYKGYKAYQPFNVYCPELDVVVHSEFRDGNVPAGHDMDRILDETLKYLPESVTEVFVRSDSAGYNWDFMLPMANGKNQRFGAIQFSVSVDVTPQFRAAVVAVEEKEWTPIVRPVRRGGKIEMEKTGHEWAEVCFVPNALAHSKNNAELRYVAIRQFIKDEKDQQRVTEQLSLPFKVMSFPEGPYKLHGIVTNRLKMDGTALVLWHWERCGKSEEAHSVMKEDLAGGHMPSSNFGSNAAWWAIMILAFNLNSAMKSLVLGGDWATRRLKALRFNLICLPGRIITHARELIIRVAKGHPSFEMLIQARRRILNLATPA